VKKALETREERAAQIRNRALFEFGQHGETPEEAAFKATLSASVNAASEAQDAYKPRRQFRAPAQKNADELTRVQSTLLEYGRYVEGVGAGVGVQRSRWKGALPQHSLFSRPRHLRRYGLSRKPKTADEKDANKAAVAQSLGAEEAEEEVR
jgi:hypothetical protein